MDKSKGDSKAESREPPFISEGNPMFWDPTMVGTVVAFVVILLSIFFLFRSKKRGRVILITGPTETGKTAIFLHLTNGRAVDTVTSTIPNESEYKPSGSNEPFLIKDLPGHDRVRNTCWENHKTGMRGIVCVIDSSGGSQAIRDSAEVIFQILTDPLVDSVKPNILIFANKQDQPTAKGVKVIRTQLEREITTLRLTKSASLQTTDGNTTARTLGKSDRDFDFDQISPIKVDFAEGCGKIESCELASVVKWLEGLAS